MCHNLSEPGETTFAYSSSGWIFPSLLVVTSLHLQVGDVTQAEEYVNYTR